MCQIQVVTSTEVRLFATHIYHAPQQRNSDTEACEHIQVNAAREHRYTVGQAEVRLQLRHFKPCYLGRLSLPPLTADHASDRARLLVRLRA